MSSQLNKAPQNPLFGGTGGGVALDQNSETKCSISRPAFVRRKRIFGYVYIEALKSSIFSFLASVKSEWGGGGGVEGANSNVTPLVPSTVNSLIGHSIKMHSKL